MTGRNDGWRQGPDTATALLVVVFVIVATVLTRWTMALLLSPGAE